MNLKDIRKILQARLEIVLIILIVIFLLQNNLLKHCEDCILIVIQFLILIIIIGILINFRVIIKSWNFINVCFKNKKTFTCFPKVKFIILKSVNIILHSINELLGLGKLVEFNNIGFKDPSKEYHNKKEKKKFINKLQNDQDIVILIILFMLIILLKSFQFWKHDRFFYYLFMIFVYWRLIDILSYQLSNILKDNIRISSIPRTIILFVVNVFEVITIFAILYLFYDALVYADCKNVINKPLEAFYFSIVTISTTGFGDIIPKIGSICAKRLVILEVVYGIFLLVIFFGSIISLANNKNERVYRFLRKNYIKHQKINNVLKNNK